MQTLNMHRRAVLRSLVVTLPMIAATLPVQAATQATQPAPGAPGTWRLIGQTHANHTADHDVIIVQGPYDNFRRIKFWYDTKGLLNGRADVTVFGMK
jgi:hypothetical protein